MKVYIAIDPGKFGYVSIINKDGKFIKAFPLLKNNKAVDVVDISQNLFDLSIYEGNCHVILEDVHSIFGSSAGANFNFGWIVGVIEGTLSTLGLSYTKVAPKTWQKVMHQGIAKNENKKIMSLMACHKIFPTVDLRRTERCTKEDDNFADSLLMAEYGRRKNF